MTGKRLLSIYFCSFYVSIFGLKNGLFFKTYSTLKSAEVLSCFKPISLSKFGNASFLEESIKRKITTVGLGVSVVFGIPGAHAISIENLPVLSPLNDVTVVQSNSISSTIEPSPAQVQEVAEAFRAFDAKELKRAERLFTNGINNWIELHRPRDEISLLYKARGNVRVDLKKFNEALMDYDTTIKLMAVDGENKDGLANYYEYPDAFVQRGLTYEGLGDWQKAVEDYTKAIKLWGGGRGSGINPYVLTFRGNALTKLGKYQESLEDYAAAGDIFSSQRDIARETDSRANYALALYETGDRESAVKIMKYIIRKNPGYADMHIALAAHAWSSNKFQVAETEWNFACNAIDVGCRKYEDLEWVSTVRRWPPSLVAELKAFLQSSPI